MNEFALLKDGVIADVITTCGTRSEIAGQYPQYEVVDLYSLPSKVQEAYQYWSERP